MLTSESGHSFNLSITDRGKSKSDLILFFFLFQSHYFHTNLIFGVTSEAVQARDQVPFFNNEGQTYRKEKIK